LACCSISINAKPPKQNKAMRQLQHDYFLYTQWGEPFIPSIIGFSPEPITEDAEYEILPSNPLLQSDPNVVIDEIIQDKIDNYEPSK
jgi:hypothetical protein